MNSEAIRGVTVGLLAVLFLSCNGDESGDHALLLSMAVLGKNEDGSPKPLPARMGILSLQRGEWNSEFIQDTESNLFHKAMAYQPAGGGGGILTFGGTEAIVKLWKPDGTQQTLWQEDFGGQFSRMRDAEIGDIYGDGSDAIAVATHDQGVVAVIRPNLSGGVVVQELDRREDTIVHEIELGDLDGNGILEIYATPSAPNKMDGTPQPGKVVRYVPAEGEGRVEVVDLGDRHAKEILVVDLDGDGRDELYVSVEAVSGGRVEIRRYDMRSETRSMNIVATLDDKLCRFLTAGDVDGDGRKELVAATYTNGLWLLRPDAETWTTELIASDSSGFEHATLLFDMAQDGRDELYVASDKQKEVRRYSWTENGWDRDTLLHYTDELGRFTWNIMPAPLELLSKIH